jgi:transposase
LEEQLVVVNLYEELGSYRAVAAVVGCDPKTVKTAVEKAGKPRAGYPRRPQVTDPYVEMIAAKVAASQGRIHARQVLRLLLPAGYQGSLRSLERALKAAKKEWRQKQMRVYRPWVSAPGDFLIVDFGEVGLVPTAAGEKRLYCFCAVLGYSRWRYVRFFTCQRFQVLAQGLAGCFERLGGVPAHVMFDNPKTVTNYFVAGLSVYNAELVRLASHYHFTPVTAAAADPESKGKVEALVRYVKSDCVPEEGFGSLGQANAWGDDWCEEVNAEKHWETKAAPAERLELERPLLRRLAERPPVASGEARLVDRMSSIRFGSARYSVPSNLRGQAVQVMVDGEEVRIVHEGGEIAFHQLQPPGGSSILDEHYPTAPPSGLRAARPRTAVERAFLELGPPAEAWLRAAAAGGTPRLQLQLAEVLHLARIHGRPAVLGALVRATQFGRFGWDDLRSILAAGTATPPAVAGGRTALSVVGLPEVPQRDLSDYRWPA